MTTKSQTPAKHSLQFRVSAEHKRRFDELKEAWDLGPSETQEMIIDMAFDEHQQRLAAGMVPAKKVVYEGMAEGNGE